MNNGLVKLTFLVSDQEFLSEIHTREQDVDNPGYINWGEDKERDQINNWIYKNTLHITPDQVNFIGRTGTFIGENGSYCQISTVKMPTEKPDIIELGPRYQGRYRRVIRIKSMPVQTPIPEELLEGLSSRGYHEITDDKIAEEAREIFCYQ